MLAWSPLVDGVAYGIPNTPPYDNNGGATPGSVMGPSPAQAAAAGNLVGTRPLTGVHNTPLHVAALALTALLVIWGLRKAGFGFSVAGRIGGR